MLVCVNPPLFVLSNGLGVVLLCVPCGALFRPIEFEPIYEEDAEDEKKKRTASAPEEASDEEPSATYREKLASVTSAPLPSDEKEDRVNGEAATTPTTPTAVYDDSKALLTPPGGANG